LSKKDPSKTLFADSDNYRTKVESRQLLDLGQTVQEKYGQQSGWIVGLRQSKVIIRNKSAVGKARKPSVSDYTEDS